MVMEFKPGNNYGSTCTLCIHVDVTGYTTVSDMYMYTCNCVRLTSDSFSDSLDKSRKSFNMAFRSKAFARESDKNIQKNILIIIKYLSLNKKHCFISKCTST